MAMPAAADLFPDRVPCHRLAAGEPPRLVVVVDTEEEFDWTKPHARENVAVSSIAAQPRAHEIFDRYGIRPVYVIDYPVATTPAAIRVLRDLHDGGRCVIGAHLHPWVNPPHAERVTTVNSYPGNLPAELEHAKLVALGEAISDNFGFMPVAYKAGRFGIGRATAETLAALGYRFDLSVVPYTSFAADGGPDFTAFDFRPFVFGGPAEILELPVSVGFHGALRDLGPQVFPSLVSPWAMRLHLPGVLARLQGLERIRLTPEGVDLPALKRLVRGLLADGCQIFSYTYHSPSLAAGHTPYVRTAADLAHFLAEMEGFFRYFLEDLGGRPATLEELYAGVVGDDRA
jgi:hypothetical protein